VNIGLLYKHTVTVYLDKYLNLIYYIVKLSYDFFSISLSHTPSQLFQRKNTYFWSKTAAGLNLKFSFM